MSSVLSIQVLYVKCWDAVCIVGIFLWSLQDSTTSLVLYLCETNPQMESLGHDVVVTVWLIAALRIDETKVKTKNGEPGVVLETILSWGSVIEARLTHVHTKELVTWFGSVALCLADAI